MHHVALFPAFVQLSIPKVWGIILTRLCSAPSLRTSIGNGQNDS